MPKSLHTNKSHTKVNQRKVVSFQGLGSKTAKVEPMPKKAKSGGKICPEGKAWARRTFDTYPSAYANMAASKYCKDPNYAKKSKSAKRKRT